MNPNIPDLGEVAHNMHLFGIRLYGALGGPMSFWVADECTIRDRMSPSGFWATTE